MVDGKLKTYRLHIHWIYKEVHGMLVAVSDVVETDSMTYLKVFTEINIQKKILQIK